MVIMANVEALTEETELDPQVLQRLDCVIAATQCAADLTRQMLAFARKQSLWPQPTNLNDVVAATSKRLGRTLGEHIEIATVLADDPWTISVDRTELEAALLSLGSNARDAMPSGGRLMIETRNIVLGERYARGNSDAVSREYAMLTVSDTGEGIPANRLEHVFEPFFTTREVGKGTGLGLSMVHGFIEQSGGKIIVSSEVGHGTTVRMYLPRLAAAPPEAAAQAEVLQRGTESNLRAWIG